MSGRDLDGTAVPWKAATQLERGKRKEEEKEMTTRVLDTLISCKEKNPNKYTLLDRDHLFIYREYKQILGYG